LTGHTDQVNAVACTLLDGRPVAVTGSGRYDVGVGAVDTTVRVWDLATGRQIGDPLSGHTKSVNALACTLLDGRPIAVTGSDDRTVRIWDLPGRFLMTVITLPSGCRDVAFTESGLLVCSFGSDLAAFRL
jgi:WD40 repeat protein